MTNVESGVALKELHIGFVHIPLRVEMLWISQLPHDDGHPSIIDWSCCKGLVELHYLGAHAWESPTPLSNI